MLKPFIPVMFSDNRIFYVSNRVLQTLIRTKEIKKFRIGDDWLDVEKDRRKSKSHYYRAPERRMNAIVGMNFDLESIKEMLERGLPPEMILGYGVKVREIIGQIEQVAKTNLSVLIQGETGTGKGYLAIVVHELSKRKTKPFVAVDCGAIPAQLIESELFGHEKGAFTGAHQKKNGKFQIADGGTIFLDEIGNLPLDLQTKLLRSLEEKTIYPVGGLKPTVLDIRVISATNNLLLNSVGKCLFREDLYYRLNEFEIHMPSLRERIDDILFLAEKLIARANLELGKKISGFSEEVKKFLLEYPWPGNIREMNNILKRATLLADRVIEIQDIPEPLFNHKRAITSLDSLLDRAIIETHSMHETLFRIRKEAEKKIIQKAYEQSGKKKQKTAKLLQIDYSTLYRKMKEYSI